MNMKSRRRGCWLAALVAALSAMAIIASSASAADYSQCPLENANVEGCFRAEVTGGEFKLGNSTVPITKTIVLQGGTYVTNPETGETAFVGAKNGETLSKTPLNVPGGLAGLVNCTEISVGWIRESCEAVFENGLTGVTATAELVGPVGYSFGHFASEKGVAMSLPLRVKLSNRFLGSGCFIGSASNPVHLQLTTGTTSPLAPNKPISGTTGKITFTEEGEALHAAGFKLVDNSFAAPEASGCGGWPAEYILDPILNLKEGLPAAAGKNTAIQTGNADSASRAIVEK